MIIDHRLFFVCVCHSRATALSWEIKVLTVVKQNILVVSYVAYMIFIGCLFCPILLPIPDFFTKDSLRDSYRTITNNTHIHW